MKLHRFLGRLAGGRSLTRSGLTFATWVAFAGCLVLTFALQVRLTLYFNQAPFDGVFQTLYPLRLIDRGLLPGRDFFYFHGNGIPYLIYPLYKTLMFLSPAELRNSLISTAVVNTVAVVAPMFICARFAVERWAAALAVFLSLLASEMLPVFGYFTSPTFVGAPMGIRLMPHLLAAAGVGWLGSRLSAQPARSMHFPALLALGFVLSALPFLGAEQGAYAMIATVAVLPFLGRTEEPAFFGIARAAVLAGSAATLFLAFQWVLFGSFTTIEAMITIAANQVWIYGVFPNAFFGSYDETWRLALISAVPSQAMTLLSLAPLLTLGLLARRLGIARGTLCSVMVLYIGGLLSWTSNIGYVGQHQAPLFLRASIICVVVLTAALLRPSVTPAPTNGHRSCP